MDDLADLFKYQIVTEKDNANFGCTEALKPFTDAFFIA